MERKRLIEIIIIAFLFLAGVGGSVLLVLQQTNLFSRASYSDKPERVRVTNISDNAFSVTWVTPGHQTIGYVSYGEKSPLGNMAIDDRDSSSLQKDRFTHHVTVVNLDPKTWYYFKIGSGDKVYDDKGKPYQIRTAPTTDQTPPVASAIYGKVIKDDNAMANDVIVYLNVKNGTLISSFARDNGNWLITANNARNVDLSGYVIRSDLSKAIDIYAEGGAWGNGRASTTISTPLVQTIKLQKTSSN